MNKGIRIRITVEILGVPVDRVTMDEALERVTGFLVEPGVHAVFTPNAEMMMYAQRDPEFHQVLGQGDLVIADGVGVVKAAQILGTPVAERVPGCDLMIRVLERGNQRGWRVFIFGGKPGIAEQAARVIQERWPGVQIAGTRNGYFTEVDEPAIVDEINTTNTDILLVALGLPKQEKWIDRHRGRLSARVCMAVGGSVDVLAGVKPRAPHVWQHLGLEWLYQMLKQPARLNRSMDNFRFGLRVVAYRIRR